MRKTAELRTGRVELNEIIFFPFENREVILWKWYMNHFPCIVRFMCWVIVLGMESWSEECSISGNEEGSCREDVTDVKEEYSWRKRNPLEASWLERKLYIQSLGRRP